MLMVTSLAMVFPLVWVFLTSFKTSQDIIRATPTLLPETWTLENYASLTKTAPFVRFFFNSLIISGVSTLFIIVTCSSAGFVFAKYRFRGKNFFMLLVIATILIPLQTYMIPLYLLTRWLGWINTYQGQIFPLIIMSSGIFFLRQNILTIPDEPPGCRADRRGLGVRGLPADHPAPDGIATRRHLHRELGLHLEHVHLAFGRGKQRGYVHDGAWASCISNASSSRFTAGSWPRAW
ncbi:MAG: carbohydrate ABC transporter permease [Rhodopseudomonas palustris]|nr:carbohydrate ABC transporter permease [Rhodopseudomonas palustris]